MTVHIDVSRAIGAVTREVERREHDGRPAWLIRATRDYATHIEDVWDALTDPERIPRWFLPVSGDFRLGGRYQFEGNAGGEITRCDAPSDLAVTWEYGGDVSWVEVRLEALSEQETRLRLEHLAHVPDEFWDQYGPGAVGVGWEQGLAGLAGHLETGASADRAEGEAWQLSAEGKSHSRASSDLWGEASIAAGTDPAAARAAAARTTAFYTGEAPGEGQ